MIKNKFGFLKTGNAKYSGFPQKVVDFICNSQVKNARLWEKLLSSYDMLVEE